MNIANLSSPELVISYGDIWDATKTVSPDVTVREDGQYLIHYVGTNCQPHERKGYRLLTGESNDGILFTKHNQPLLDYQQADDKHYSPCLRRWGDDFLLFYGLGSQGKYVINIARSRDGKKFTPDLKPIVDIRPGHIAAVHSPKVVIDSANTIHCYYTGSNDAGKIYSRAYPEYDFANGFKLFKTTSDDAKSFTAPKAITVEGADFQNLYGHSVLTADNLTYLVFTGFDGAVNRLYITTSKDGLRFAKPAMIGEPDPANDELGLYSSSLLKLGNGQFRIYYACRYFDNRWKILTRTFSLED
jgi:hypothetical protein